MSDDPKPRSDVGMLFIHGVGQQARGATLAEAGDAVVGWLSSVGCRVRFDNVDLADGGASLEVRPPGADDGATQSWRLDESWWASAFPPPGVRDVIEWSLSVVPNVLLMHFAKSAVRLTRSPLGQLLAGPISLLALVAALVLVPALLLLILVATLLRLIPLQIFQPATQAMQRAISQFIGDSYVLVTSPLRREAIYSRIGRDIAAAAARCRRLVIVAHSQGAAVAHEMLGRHCPAEVALLVTHGSGFEKLEFLETAQRLRGSGRLMAVGALFVSAMAVHVLVTRQFGIDGWRMTIAAFFAAAALAVISYKTLAYIRRAASAVDLLLTVTGFTATLTFVTLVALRPLADPFAPVFLTSFALITFVFVALLNLAVRIPFDILTRTQPGTGDPESDNARVGLPERLDWLDLYATSDPVPNGAIYGVKTRSRSVHNRASLFFDHTIYWRNLDQFVGRVMHAAMRSLGDAAPVPASSVEDALEHAASRRRQRVRLLWVARQALLATAFVLAASHTARCLASAASCHTIPQWLAAAPLPDWLTDAAARYPGLAGVALTILAALVVYSVVFIGWSAWNRGAMRRAYAPNEPRCRDAV